LTDTPFTHVMSNEKHLGKRIPSETVAFANCDESIYPHSLAEA
jgi:hypothetical protein